VQIIAGQYRFSVEDTGIGIAKEDLDNIFTSFHQLDHQAQGYIEGTGLGLAISEQLVRLMGGQLQVNSQLGVGSRFWFDLELATADQTIQTDSTLPDGRVIIAMKGDGRKILITDDDADNRHLLINMLTPFGFELHEASNGLDCIEQSRLLKPDLILMDSKMPTMDGLQACEQIRNTSDIKHINIIAISADAYQYHRQQCLDAGANDFLVKPLQLEQLLRMVAQYTGSKPVYETSKTESLATPENYDNQEHFPPRKYLENLLISAEQGDIQAIREQLDAVKQLDNSYLTFLEQLSDHTSHFQINKICQLLKLAINQQDENR
jgi:CheY-like chemotaxis protein